MGGSWRRSRSERFAHVHHDCHGSVAGWRHPDGHRGRFDVGLRSHNPARGHASMRYEFPEPDEAGHAYRFPVPRSKPDGPGSLPRPPQPRRRVRSCRTVATPVDEARPRVVALRLVGRRARTRRVLGRRRAGSGERSAASIVVSSRECRASMSGRRQESEAVTGPTWRKDGSGDDRDDDVTGEGRVGLATLLLPSSAQIGEMSRLFLPT
jgi:hypothetical protein